MNKHAKQLAAIAELFGQVLYRVPQENRRLALALFKAAMAVVLDGSDEIGSEFSKRALAWNSDRKARTDQTADDMQTWQVVDRLRKDAQRRGEKKPPLSRLKKKGRRTAFELGAEKLDKGESTVEGAVLRHQKLRNPRQNS